MIILILLALILIIIELQHFFRPKSPLYLNAKDWKLTRNKSNLILSGELDIINPHRKIEVMLTKIKIKPILLGKYNVRKLKTYVEIEPKHKDHSKRQDNYWFAYIIKSKDYTTVSINIEIKAMESIDDIKSLHNAWLDFIYESYGPFGRITKSEGYLFSIKKPEILDTNTCNFIEHKNYKILPIKTHLLGRFDNIYNVLNEYTINIRKKGDILTIGETPLAIIQGRYHNPHSISPSFLALLLCRSFHPTSSLATSCGLQSLIDIVGPSRVLISWLIGAILKLVGIKGCFYRLAGEQARLIDDITGTTPPYDQNIVLGPLYSEEICNEAAKRLGIEVAVVDVNDLGRVKILASSKNCNKDILLKCLKDNPAGNGNEQTPLVLLRPS